MRRLSSIIIASLMVVGLTYGQSDLTAGIKHIANENYGEATKFFEKVMIAEPKNGLPIYYLGKIKYALEEYGAASDMFNKGALLDKKCTLCQIAQAQVLLDNGKVVEADKMLLGLDKANKKSAAMLAAIGDAYLYSKKPNATKAVSYLTRSRDIDPKVGSTWSHLGEAYTALNDGGNAISSYEVAVQKDKTNVEAYIAMSRIWKATKNNDLAVQKLEEAVKLAPDFAPVYKSLYEMYIATKKFDKVLPVLEKYVSLAGNDEAAKVRLVKFLTYQAKDYDRAIKEALEIKKTSNDYTINRWLAWSYGESEKYQESYDASKALFSDIATDKVARKAYDFDSLYLAKSALKLGKTDEALALYDEIWKSKPESKDEVLGTLASDAYKAKDFQSSLKYFAKKAEIKPLNTTDQSYVGLAHFNLKDYVNAELAFTKLTEISPKYTFGYYYKAKSVERQDPDRVTYAAIPHYQKYLEIASTDATVKVEQKIEAYKYIGYGLVSKEDFIGAKAAFDNILLLDPTNEDANKNSDILAKGGK